MKKEFVISTDLGGTKILSALINSKNEIVDRVKIPTDIKNGPKFIVECIANSVKELLEKSNLKSDNIQAISLGVPGTVNPLTGVIAVAPNLKIENFNIKDALMKYFPIPVLIENDVNMAGLGIKLFEFKNKINNMMVVFVGTGIGGALFFNGNLYRGSSFYAGEIGHIKVKSNGFFTGDSKKLSFENIASRTAVVNFITSKAKKQNTFISQYIKGGKKIKSKILDKAIEKKDIIVLAEVSKSCKTIGTVLGSITTLLNIDTIVLGGGMIEANEEFMLPKIKKAFNDSVLPAAGKIVKIVATKLGDDAALYGGLALAQEFVENK